MTENEKVFQLNKIKKSNLDVFIRYYTITELSESDETDFEDDGQTVRSGSEMPLCQSPDRLSLDSSQINNYHGIAGLACQPETIPEIDQDDSNTPVPERKRADRRGTDSSLDSIQDYSRCEGRLNIDPPIVRVESLFA